MFAPRSIPLYLILVIFTIDLFGCGGSKPRSLPKWPVSGEITFDGQHLPDGQIIFIHDSGDMASVMFKADGKYQATVAQGKNLVMIKSFTASGGDPEGKNRAASMYIETSRIPQKYTSPTSSGLEFDVKPGANTYNVELKSK